MEWLVWVGAALTLVGVALIGLCVVMAVKSRKGDQDEAQAKARMQKVVALNMLALFISIIGLGAVSIGIILA